MMRRTFAKDGPHPVDVLVGRRARERRTLEGMSQSAVAAKLGLTFQQLQKYERGHNRISASRLYELAQLFDVPVAYFYEEIEAGKGAPSRDDMVAKRETLELVRAYYAISDPAVRHSIRKLTQAAAKFGQSPASGRRRAPAIEFDKSKIDGRTKVGKAALAVLKKRGRRSKADIEALAAVGYPVAAHRQAPPVQAIEFDRSKIDGRTKVGKAALAALKKRGRKSKADLEALAAVDYPGAAAKLADR